MYLYIHRAIPRRRQEQLNLAHAAAQSTNIIKAKRARNSVEDDLFKPRIGSSTSRLHDDSYTFNRYETAERRRLTSFSPNGLVSSLRVRSLHRSLGLAAPQPRLEATRVQNKVLGEQGEETVSQEDSYPCKHPPKSIEKLKCFTGQGLGATPMVAPFSAPC